MVKYSCVSFLLVPPGKASVVPLPMNVGEMDHEFHQKNPSGVARPHSVGFSEYRTASIQCGGHDYQEERLTGAAFGD